MKKALLVGINKYPRSPLRGCVNDVLITYKTLTEKLGFESKNVEVLTDHECTKKNIVNNIKKLTRNVKSNDTIYFHYSGHGSQVNVDDWTNTDEPDGRDEILCPVDLNWNDPLRDHELGYYFKSTPKDSIVLVVLDCCHSGTGLRNFDYDESHFIGKTEVLLNRFIAPPISNILSNPKMKINDNLEFEMPDFNERDVQTQKQNFLINTTKQGDVILISGCQDNQTSADAWLGKKFFGALTYSLNKILAKADYDITYKSLVREINRDMDKNKFTQNPQLECTSFYFNSKFLK